MPYTQAGRPAAIITALGEDKTVRLELPDGSNRYWNGIFCDFMLKGRDRSFTTYEGTLCRGCGC